MSNLVYAEVPIGSTAILSFRDGDTVYIPLRNICEKLGLDWSNERRRIKKDPILGKAVVNFTTALSSGQEQACIALNYLPGWLFKVNLNTVAEAARPTLELIQREGYEALYNYWTKGAAINPRFGGTPAAAGVQDVIRLLDAVKREPTLAGRTVLYQMLGQACAARGIETPALDDLTPFAREDAAADALLARIDVLIAKQPEIEWHRSPELLAVRGRDLEARGILIPKPLIAAMERHPRFVGRKSVNGRDGRARHCWVFKQTGAEG